MRPLEGEGPEVELGCDLRRDKWNQGIATEAGRACLEYGFGELGLERIVAVTNPQNRGARRALEKLGFVEEGRGEHYGSESVVFLILKENWK